MVALLLAAPAALLPALILLGRYERRTLESVPGDRVIQVPDAQPVIRAINTRIE